MRTDGARGPRPTRSRAPRRAAPWPPSGAAPAAALLGFAALAVAPVLPGAAQDAEARVPAVLEGRWRSAVPPERQRAIILGAFEPRIAGLPSLVRGMVRGRIEERMSPARRLEIALEGERVRVTNVGRRRVVVDTPLGGSARVRGDDGEVRRVTQQLRGGWLEQVFADDSGTVTRLLSVEPDGRTLHADLTVTHERLGAPVRWRLDYARVAAD